MAHSLPDEGLPYAPRMALPTPAPDRTALVTGASSGIGVELARRLAEQGHGVTLVARREGPLQELAGELAGAHGIRAEVIPTDLADDSSRDALVAELGRRGLEVHILVNNAGFSTMGPVHRSDASREVLMVRTDVEAVVHLCSALVPGMVQRGTGAVLNVASTAAFQPLPGQAAYGGSKAFVLSYTQSLAQELKGTGVTATALCPGPVETGFAAAAGIGEDEAGESLPRIMWVSAEDVAKSGLDALAKGKRVAIPGTANRVLAVVAAHTPRALVLPVLARQHPALRD
jgi:short-subunit dehydrogenase